MVAGAGALLLSACAPDPPSAVVGIVTDACDPGLGTGSGAIVAPGLVLTSAHVVAGAQSISVRRGTEAAPATIVGFDPEMDLAYLAIDGLPATPFRVGTGNATGDDIEDGTDATAYVVRDAVVVALPVTIRRPITIITEDIYVEGTTRRPGFELDAAIEVGDSGGAVMVDGTVVGVLWARSRQADDRAYAIDPTRAGDLIADQLRTGDLGPDVDLSRCP